MQLYEKYIVDQASVKENEMYVRMYVLSSPLQFLPALAP